MSAPLPLPELEFIPYLDENGQLPEFLQGKVGAYGIFDRTQTLQLVGFSRDIALSLRQHLVRQPQRCYWVKVQIVDRPSRTALETIRDHWIAENGETPPGNGTEQGAWNEPIEVRSAMTPEEQQRYASAMDEASQSKVLKTVARRVEAALLAELASRGARLDIRFNPKLKESGLLDLK